MSTGTCLKAKPLILDSKRSVPLWLSGSIHPSGYMAHLINDFVSSLHMIMYADDICAVSDTVGRVQSQLNVLEMFCQRYGLVVKLYGENQIDDIQEWRAFEN